MSEVIVCTASAEILRGLREILPGIYKDLNFASNSKELSQMVLNCPDSTVLIFDCEFLENLEDAQVARLEEQFKSPFVLISTRELGFNVAQLKRSEKISHVIGHRPGHPPEELAKVLTQVLQQKAFGEGRDIREVFNVDPSQVTQFSLENSEERWDCYKKLSVDVAALPVFTGFADIATTVASELITNAFYNGPRSQDGEDEALQPSRKQAVQLVPPKNVEFCYWSDGEYFWLMVTDPFGSLKKSKLISALHRAVTQRTAVVDGVGGAGLGLSMIAEWASELYFGLAQSHSTWIACRLRITKRRKAFFDQRSNLHIYEIALPRNKADS